jgi:hypothetical protein
MLCVHSSIYDFGTRATHSYISVNYCDLAGLFFVNSFFVSLYIIYAGRPPLP